MRREEAGADLVCEREPAQLGALDGQGGAGEIVAERGEQDGIFGRRLHQ